MALALTAKAKTEREDVKTKASVFLKKREFLFADTLLLTFQHLRGIAPRYFQRL
jgi:hypothetical protein